jgi:hypothetical protein
MENPFCDIMKDGSIPAGKVWKMGYELSPDFSGVDRARGGPRSPIL